MARRGWKTKEEGKPFQGRRDPGVAGRRDSKTDHGGGGGIQIRRADSGRHTGGLATSSSTDGVIIDVINRFSVARCGSSSIPISIPLKNKSHPCPFNPARCSFQGLCGGFRENRPRSKPSGRRHLRRVPGLRSAGRHSLPNGGGKSCPFIKV